MMAGTRLSMWIENGLECDIIPRMEGGTYDHKYAVTNIVTKYLQPQNKQVKIVLLNCQQNQFEKSLVNIAAAAAQTYCYQDTSLQQHPQTSISKPTIMLLS